MVKIWTLLGLGASVISHVKIVEKVGGIGWKANSKTFTRGSNGPTASTKD